MKSYYAIPFFAAVVLAQDGPNCGIITQPPLDDKYPAGSRPIAVAIVAINQTTVALNQSIDAFDGSPSAIANLQGVANTVLTDIQEGNANATLLPGNADDDDGQTASYALVTYVGGLACTVNATVDNLINARQRLIDACVGPIVLDNVQQQQNESLAFEATVKSKISPSLQSFADILVDPINVALSSAVSIFADQTTLPASCSSTSTTTTTTGTTSTSDVTSSTATATGSGTGSATGSSSAYPTGGYGWSPIPYPSDSSSYAPSSVPPYGAQPTGTTGGLGSYPTSGSGSYSTGGVPSKPSTTGNAVWQPIPYPSGTSSHAVTPKPSSVYGTWEAVTVTVPFGGSSSKPSGSYSPAHPSSPVSSSGWEAVYTTYSATKAPATTGSKLPIYTGAAAANLANGMGAAAFVALAAAAVL